MRQIPYNVDEYKDAHMHLPGNYFNEYNSLFGYIFIQETPNVRGISLWQDVADNIPVKLRITLL